MSSIVSSWLKYYCVKSARIRSFSGPYFPAFGLNTGISQYSVRMRENTDQKNSEYGHFSRSVQFCTYECISRLLGKVLLYCVISKIGTVWKAPKHGKMRTRKIFVLCHVSRSVEFRHVCESLTVFLQQKTTIWKVPIWYIFYSLERWLSIYDPIFLFFVKVIILHNSEQERQVWMCHHQTQFTSIHTTAYFPKCVNSSLNYPQKYFLRYYFLIPIKVLIFYNAKNEIYSPGHNNLELGTDLICKE